MSNVDWNGNYIDALTSEEIAATRKDAILNGRNPDQAVTDAEGFRTDDRARQETRDALFAERQASRDRLQKVLDDAVAAGRARDPAFERAFAEQEAIHDANMADPKKNPFAGKPGKI